MSLRGKQANGLVTQQRVLRAAVAQFLEKGYTGTTTADITGAAGIAQSSFFHVFPSKEALLLELVRRMFGGQFDLAGQHSGAAAGDRRSLSAGSTAEGFLRNGDRVRRHHAQLHGSAVRPVLHHRSQDRPLSGLRAQALQRSGGAAAASSQTAR